MGVYSPKNALIPRTYDLLAPRNRQESIAAEVDARLEGLQSKNTRDAYQSDWDGFLAWLGGESLTPAEVSPDVLAKYLLWMQEESSTPKSIDRAYCGVTRFLQKELPNHWSAFGRPPVIRSTLKLIRRENQTPLLQKHPWTAVEMGLLVRRKPPWDGLRAIRNIAIISTGLATASRRSEIVKMRRRDVVGAPEGLKIHIWRSKTDQEGEGYTKALFPDPDLSVCPIEALKRWLRAARASGAPIAGDSPLFRALGKADEVLPEPMDDREVALIVKDAARAIGRDPKLYSGHSLRAGFVTEASARGDDLDKIMRQTGHKSVEQVRQYIRHLSPFVNNASEGIMTRARKKIEAQIAEDATDTSELALALAAAEPAPPRRKR